MIVLGETAYKVDFQAGFTIAIIQVLDGLLHLLITETLVLKRR
jgi:hypothetical protein